MPKSLRFSVICSLLTAAALLGGCGASGERIEAAVAPNKAQAAATPEGAPADSATAAPPTAAACGNAGLPDCPMQRWMKATLQTYQRAGDQERLARAFNELADHAPAGYDTWQALAKQGADAAARSDVAAVKQVCKDCHHAHRSRFRKERRSAPTW